MARQEFPYQPFNFYICKLEEKKKKKGNPRRKAILFVAKLTNSTMHLSFTFGDMKFKKYINFNYPAGNMDT